MGKLLSKPSTKSKQKYEVAEEQLGEDEHEEQVVTVTARGNLSQTKLDASEQLKKAMEERRRLNKEAGATDVGKGSDNLSKEEEPC